MLASSSTSLETGPEMSEKIPARFPCLTCSMAPVGGATFGRMGGGAAAWGGIKPKEMIKLRKAIRNLVTLSKKGTRCQIANLHLFCLALKLSNQKLVTLSKKGAKSNEKYSDFSR